MGQPLKRRNSLRLQGYDYAWEGAYFVTICAYERQHLFSDINDGVMSLNTYGKIVEQEWYVTLEKWPYVKSEIFMIMPNHFHAIVSIDYQDVLSPTLQDLKSDSVGARRASPNVTGAAPQSLGAIIGGFKSAVTWQIRIDHEVTGEIWQRGYHEHTIRSEESYHQIHSYIVNNPVNWIQDSLFQAG